VPIVAARRSRGLDVHEDGIPALGVTVLCACHFPDPVLSLDGLTHGRKRPSRIGDLEVAVGIADLERSGRHGHSPVVGPGECPVLQVGNAFRRGR